MTALITSHPGHIRERGEWRLVRAKCMDVSSANEAKGPRSEPAACAGVYSAALAAVARARGKCLQICESHNLHLLQYLILLYTILSRSEV